MLLEKKILSKKNFIIFFFISFFFVGINVVKDYGVSSDEYQHRFHGFINLDHVGKKIFPKTVDKYKEDKSYPSFDNYRNNFYGGVVFNSSAALIELLFKIKDKKNQFLLKHYLNFLIFFLSLISFYKIIKIRFSNWTFPLIGVVFLILSPRIFANSFYNPTDLIFMSFCIFAIQYGLIFFKNPNLKNSILFSLFAALSINMRIMGIIIPALIYLLIFFYLFQNLNLIRKYFYPIIISFLILPVLTIIFWPYLWDAPLENFINSFIKFSNFHHFGGAENLFLGNYVKSTELPWTYVPVWILITTPIFYIFLFLFGIFKITYNLFYTKYKDNEKILIDIFFLLLFFIPIISVIVLNSTLYNGWRHLYFIYPGLIIITLVAIEFFYNHFKNKRIKFFIKFFIIINVLYISFWMIKNHPHQYVYFNSFAGKDIKNKFDMDYWGLSYKENFDYLLENDSSDEILIWNSSAIKIFYPLLSINEKDRTRIIKVKFKEDKFDAKYWITNYYIDKNNYDDEFFKKYKIYKTIFVDGEPINTIFKKKL